MAKTRHAEKPRAAQETVFVFPDRCSLGVVESVLDDALAPVRFSVIDLAVNQSLESEFHEVLRVLRLSNSVRITQLPQLEQDARDREKNSLIISFHEEKETKKDWENPLLAAVVAIGNHPGQTELSAFNDHILKLECLGLSLDFGDELSVVMLLDLLAVGSSLFYESTAVIGNYFFKPLYYAQFQPALRNSLEPLIHALSHCRKTSPSLLDKNAVNLTGLLPDAFA